MGFFAVFKKKSEEELRTEILELKAKRDGIALSPKDEYKALLKERNDLKWGKTRAQVKKVFQAIGKVSEAHNEHGLDMGEGKKKEGLKTTVKASKTKLEEDFTMDYGFGNMKDPNKPVKTSKTKTSSKADESFTMDYGFGTARDPAKPLKGEIRTASQGSFWEGSTK